MKIYIYKEHTPGFENPHYFAYAKSERREYIANTCADSAEKCEEKARQVLTGQNYELVREVEV